MPADWNLQSTPDPFTWRYQADRLPTIVSGAMPHERFPMIAAIYARKSTEQIGADADAKSVNTQIANARAFAQTKGWTVTHVYKDDAVSGGETVKLVQRQRLWTGVTGRATAP